MRTFNILGEQIVIDEPKERYHEIREFVEEIRLEIFEHFKRALSHSNTVQYALSIFRSEFKDLYIYWMKEISGFLKQKYGYECTDRQFYDEVINTQEHGALQSQIVLSEIDKAINEGEFLSLEEFANFFLIALKNDTAYMTDTCVYLLTEKQSNSITVYRKKSYMFTDCTLQNEMENIYQRIAFDPKLDKEEIKNGFIKIIKTYPYLDYGEYFFDMLRIFGVENTEIMRAAAYFLMKSPEDILKMYSNEYLPVYNSSGESSPSVQAQKTLKRVQKDKWTAFFLCLFLGLFGAHKFYEGKGGMGILYFFTGGLCFIGIVVDLITILRHPNPYYVEILTD